MEFIVSQSQCCLCSHDEIYRCFLLPLRSFRNRSNQMRAESLQIQTTSNTHKHDVKDKEMPVLLVPTEGDVNGVDYSRSSIQQCQPGNIVGEHARKRQRSGIEFHAVSMKVAAIPQRRSQPASELQHRHIAQGMLGSCAVVLENNRFLRW